MKEIGFVVYSIRNAHFLHNSSMNEVLPPARLSVVKIASAYGHLKG